MCARIALWQPWGCELSVEGAARIPAFRVDASGPALGGGVVDGLEMLSRSQGSGLVDGVHPNSLGFQWCANGLEPQLRRALKLPSKRR